MSQNKKRMNKKNISLFSLFFYFFGIEPEVLHFSDTTKQTVYFFVQISDTLV
jgi:hypothetical protein